MDISENVASLIFISVSLIGDAFYNDVSAIFGQQWPSRIIPIVVDGWIFYAVMKMMERNHPNELKRQIEFNEVDRERLSKFQNFVLSLRYMISYPLLAVSLVVFTIHVFADIYRFFHVVLPEVF